jgi:hypothetical protein
MSRVGGILVATASVRHPQGGMLYEEDNTKAKCIRDCDGAVAFHFLISKRNADQRRDNRSNQPDLDDHV